MGKKAKRPWGVLIAIFLGIFTGSILGKEASLFGFSLYHLFDTLGQLFLNALTLVVVPLVSSSVISGIARIGSEGTLGRLGLKMGVFYVSTTFLAVLIGLFFVNLFSPGIGAIPPGAEATTHVETLTQQANMQGGSALTNLVISIIPSNVLQAFSKGEMLGLIFFSILFGYSISKIEEGTSSVLKRFFLGVFQTMIHITHIIMKFLPYGVFFLVARVFMETGLQSLKSVALFSAVVLLGLITFTFVGLPLMLRLIARVSPVRHFRAMAPALVTAFSTSSSSATLPITIECVEKRAGVSNRICSLVVPLGTSINMSGSALYECVSAMFIAQAYGIDLSFPTQLFITIMSLLASFGVAGIPSGSLIAVLLILKAAGLPKEGIGLILAVDRILDMCRTTVNVFSDSCCAVLVARSEGEKNVLTKESLASSED